jgi:hypothetical protein
MAVPGDRAQPPRRARPFQYSLQSALILMTATAVALSLLVASPVWLARLTAFVLGMALPMVLTVTLVYGRGPLRTFSIGALFPAGLMCLSAVGNLSYNWGAGMFAGGRPEERPVIVGFIVCACLAIVLFGLVALGVRRLVERHTAEHAERLARAAPEEPHAGAENSSLTDGPSG